MPNIWDDKVYVAIAKDGGSNNNWCSKTRDIDIGGGERNIEVIYTNCGNIVKKMRQEMFEVSFNDAIPVEVSDFRQLKEGGSDASQPIEVTSSTSMDQMRVVILWTDQTGVTSAAQSINTSSTARRCVLKDGYFTSMDESWSDRELSANLTFKFPAQDNTGSGNVLWQSCDSSEALGSLTDYTSGVFGN